MAEETTTSAQATAAAPVDATNAAETAAPNTVLGGAEATAGEAKPGNDAAPGEQGAGKETGDEAGDGEKSDDKPAGAPEKYELQLPEGFSLDDAAMGKFDPVLRELNLTNEQASKLASVYAEMQMAQAEQHATLVQEWGGQAAADAEYGGQAFAQNVELAKSALAKHGTPELKTLLDSTGLGNHPEVVRFFYRVGKSLPTEDGVVRGDRSGGERSLAERLYGSTTPKP